MRPVKKTKQSIVPREVTTETQLCALQSSCVDTKGHWMLMQQAGRGFEVVIVNQFNGEEATGKVHLPIRVFAKMAEWFTTPQPTAVREKRIAPSRRKQLTRKREDA